MGIVDRRSELVKKAKDKEKAEQLKKARKTAKMFDSLQSIDEASIMEF